MENKPHYETIGVPPRVWYYILDYINRPFEHEVNNRSILEDEFGVCRIRDLTKEQIITLFDKASKKDIEELKK